MSETLHVDRQGSITVVALKGKTMTTRLFSELAEVFAAIAEDAEARAVIVRSQHRDFTFGLDLQSAFADLGAVLQGGLAGPRMALKRTIERLQAGIDAVADCPVPVIAAVSGRCIGGGIDLITACDLRLASADAVFSVRETKVAIVADLGTLQRLPRIVGPGHARELAFTGKDIDAARAAAIGLVNHVHADADALQAAALALAQEIAENPPLTVRGVKDVMNFSADRDVASGLAYVAAYNAACLPSEDLGEAAAAFFARRAPSFRGR
ncbi:MAG: crotonase/enoyl-CoA hydratase family protein [Nannocystaceae bacterium]